MELLLDELWGEVVELLGTLAILGGDGGEAGEAEDVVVAEGE